MLEPITFEAADEEATDRLARALAESLPDGVTIELSGTLGAGKTRLVQGIAAACGVARHDVTSPTFVICQDYVGSRTVHHLDVYRLHDEDEFLDLGPEEWFESPDLTVVEWGDRYAHLLPAARIKIDIQVTGYSSRQFTISATDETLAGSLANVRSALAAP